MRRSLPPLGPDERRLLLACGRLTDGPQDNADLLVERPLDWEAVVAHARFHSVAPLVHRRLERLGAWPLVPDAARRGLLQLTHRASFQNRAFARENGAILDALARAGIPAIVQKGLSLVELIYRDLSLRPLIDLVFLVPRDQLADAARVLEQQGYRERRPAAQEMLYRWCCPQRFVEADREINVAVLLQADLVNWPRLHSLAMGPLFDRATRACLSGHGALVLAPEDQILYLCLQADNHGTFNRVAAGAMNAVDAVFTPWMNNRQIRFTDIFETIRRQPSPIDWPALVDRAIDAGVDEAVRISLALTGALFEPVVPREQAAALTSVTHRHRVRRWVFQSVASTDNRGWTAVPSSRLQRLGGRFWLSRSPGRQIHLGRIIGLAEFCFPEPGQLRRRNRTRSSAWLPAAYIRHASASLARSCAAYAGRRVGRLLERLRPLPLLRSPGTPAGDTRP